MYRSKLAQVRIVTSGVRRIAKAFYTGIIVFSASQVGATLYINSEGSDGSTYCFQEPCSTTISNPWEFNSEIQLSQGDVDLRDGAILASDLHGMQQFILFEIGPEDQVVAIHGGATVLKGNSSTITPAGSIDIIASEATPVGLGGLTYGGTIHVSGVSIDGPSPVVPEPSTMALLMVGAMGMMVLHRRQWTS